jgi:hypothetical protein
VSWELTQALFQRPVRPRRDVSQEADAVIAFDRMMFGIDGVAKLELHVVR